MINNVVSTLFLGRGPGLLPGWFSQGGRLGGSACLLQIL